MQPRSDLPRDWRTWKQNKDPFPQKQETLGCIVRAERREILQAISAKRRFGWSVFCVFDECWEFSRAEFRLSV